MLVHYIKVDSVCDHKHTFAEIQGLNKKAAYAFLGVEQFPTDSIEIDQAKGLMILTTSNEKAWSYTTHIFIQIPPQRSLPAGRPQSEPKQTGLEMFSVVADGSISGHSLICELPGTSTKRISQIFGIDAVRYMDPRAKYSDRIVIKSDKTGETFSLYMCYGVWRIGGVNRESAELERLQELI